jgi:hypothetical protein
LRRFRLDLNHPQTAVYGIEECLTAFLGWI